MKAVQYQPLSVHLPSLLCRSRSLNIRSRLLPSKLQLRSFTHVSLSRCTCIPAVTHPRAHLCQSARRHSEELVRLRYVSRSDFRPPDKQLKKYIYVVQLSPRFSFCRGTTRCTTQSQMARKNHVHLLLLRLGSSSPQAAHIAVARVCVPLFAQCSQGCTQTWHSPLS